MKIDMDALAKDIAAGIPKETRTVLTERQKTHGSFADNARLSQRLKEVFREGNYTAFGPIHREACDMIALKLSRILSGQEGFRDHWADIAGYALLGAEDCENR